eukprot:486641_1
MSFCPPPFTPTKYESFFHPVPDVNCGLQCKYNNVLWKLQDYEMNLIDTFWWIYTILFLILCIIVWINICMNIKYSSEKCIHRPYLFQAPFCLNISYTIAAICFLIPLIVGKDNIICSKDIDNIKTVSVINPGSSSSCTLLGIVWYTAKMLIALYTATFSITLWKQFYAPLNSIYTELKHKIYCKCCCYSIEIISSAICCNCKSCICCSCKDNNTNADSPFIDVMYSKKFLLHYCIFIISIAYTTFGYINHKINPIDPFGICSIGTVEYESTIIYLVIPHTCCLTISSSFLLPAVILFIRIHKQSEECNSSQTKAFSYRLLIYFICVEVAFNLVTISTLFFYYNRSKFEDGVDERLTCLTINGGQNVDECYIGYTYWFGWYITLGLLLPIFNFGSLVLSCNNDNWNKWKYCCCCKESGFLLNRKPKLSVADDYGAMMTTRDSIELSVSKHRR